MKLRVGVLASGSGTNLQALLDANLGQAEVVIVICNVPGAQALDRGRAAGIETLLISHREYGGREAFETALVDALSGANVDLVVLAGFMRVLTPHFLSAYADRVINIHPSLLPAFPGLDAQQKAHEAGVRISGCTVHLVDAGVDTGPILAQAAVPVLATDSLRDLQRRILAAEHRLLPATVRKLADGNRALGSRLPLTGDEASAEATLVSPALFSDPPPPEPDR